MDIDKVHVSVGLLELLVHMWLSQTLSVKENKPPIVNTQCVVYLLPLNINRGKQNLKIWFYSGKHSQSL